MFNRRSLLASCFAVCLAPLSAVAKSVEVKRKPKPRVRLRMNQPAMGAGKHRIEVLTSDGAVIIFEASDPDLGIWNAVIEADDGSIADCTCRKNGHYTDARCRATSDTHIPGGHFIEEPQ